MKWMRFLIAIGILAIVAAVVITLTNNVRNTASEEGFENPAAAVGHHHDGHHHDAQEEVGHAYQENVVDDEEGASCSKQEDCPESDSGPASSEAQNETYKTVQNADIGETSLPKDCFPKDQLTPAELLPGDANSTWAQVNPAGQGSVADQNFLNAGHHVGINTVGQTLRNANLQLRSEPPNPQVKVSPWLQTTIEPDTNRRALEIG